MKRTLGWRFLLLAIPLIFLATAGSAQAHQSGCHRWHSCPSDRGTYTCGDTGYCNYCPDNSYCKNGAYNPGGQQTQINAPTSDQNAVSNPLSGTQNDVFIGIPTTISQLLRCLVVGNKYSNIYHLKGSKYIRSMSLKKKVCFATESEATAAGFRKAKAR